MSNLLYFITGNAGKVRELTQMLSESNITIRAQNIDSLYEVQSSDPIKVCVDKARQARLTVKEPLIVEDTCLCFNALEGLPGPFMLYKLLNGFEDKSAYALTTIALLDEKDNLFTFQGRTDGHIVEPRGANDFGWDPCFQPVNFNQTYAEMSAEQKNKISHRYKCLEQLKQHYI